MIEKNKGLADADGVTIPLTLEEYTSCSKPKPEAQEFYDTSDFDYDDYYDDYSSNDESQEQSESENDGWTIKSNPMLGCPIQVSRES